MKQIVPLMVRVERTKLELWQNFRKGSPEHLVLLAIAAEYLIDETIFMGYIRELRPVLADSGITLKESVEGISALRRHGWIEIINGPGEDYFKPTEKLLDFFVGEKVLN